MLHDPDTGGEDLVLASERGVEVLLADGAQNRAPSWTPDGRYVLDFNKAYNPACAFSDHYNCPIPSKANTLKFAIRAGEPPKVRFRDPDVVVVAEVVGKRVGYAFLTREQRARPLVRVK